MPSNSRSNPPWSPLAWTLAVAAYLLLNVLSQLAVSPTANFDQAEVLLLSQDFRLGYTAQPPLYVWFTAALDALLGPSLAANMLFKALLLAASTAVALLVLREAGGTRAQAAAMLAAFACIPTVIWESQRALTHTSLAVLCVYATLWQLARLRGSPTPGRYVLIGVLAGLAVLAKYNTALALASLLMAMLALPSWRGLLLSRQAGLTALAAAAVVAPHLGWLLNHPGALQPTIEKLESGRAVASRLRGLRDLLRSAVDFAGPLALTVLLARATGRVRAATARTAPGMLVATVTTARPAPAASPPPADSPAAQLHALLSAQLLCGLLLTLLVVLWSGAGHFEERWLLPVFVTLPLWVALSVRSARTRAWLAGVGLALACTAAVLLPGRVLLGERPQRERPPLVSMPYRELARQMR